MQEKEEIKKAIKVFQFMTGVASKPIDRNDPSVIHPDEPWNSWARDGSISSGKKICEFIDWPGAEKMEEEKKDEGGTNDENKDKETTPPGKTDDKAKEEEKPTVAEESKEKLNG